MQQLPPPSIKPVSFQEALAILGSLDQSTARQILSAYERYDVGNTPLVPLEEFL